METVEFTLPAKIWQGIVTKFPADTKLVDADQFTAGSFNFLTNFRGIITKRSGGVFYNAIAFPTPNKDEYEAVFSSGVRHKLIMEGGNLRYSSGGGTFSLVTAGYVSTANMEFSMYRNRAYFGNGINTPQAYDIVNSYGGVGYTVPKTKDMGAYPPGTAPTFAADTAGGSVPAGAHTYKVTFLYYDSEESNGGPASGVHTVVASNFTVNLTAIPIGGYGVTARKIYRDNNDGNWELIGTISNNTATVFTDTQALGTLPIPTDNGLPPVFSLIVTHRDRLWVAGVTDSPSNIYWSEAGLPDIFFVNNTLLCNPRDPITALAVYNDKVIVFNRNSMGQILGTTAADFRYSEISPSVGCVDNRSIQIRTIRGVPTLMWLSNLGFYQFNGSSITDISDEIDDQLQFNIQQALQVKGKNTQSTQADFLAGTASPGIDLTTVPGTITTKGYTGTNNPTKLWDSESEWEGGSSLTNIATNDNSNRISVPTKHDPAFNAGSNNNTVEIAGTLRTPVAQDYIGESIVTAQGVHPEGVTAPLKAVAQRIKPPRNGTVTDIGVMMTRTNLSATSNVRINLWSDSGGVPGSIMFSSAFVVPPNGTNNISTGPISQGLVGNTAYWIGLEYSGTQAGNQWVEGGIGWEAQASNIHALSTANGTTWNEAANGTGNIILGLLGHYNFTQTAVATTGLWIGPTYDSKSDSAVSATIVHSGSYPASTGATTTIEAADNSAFTVGLTTQAFTNLAGTGVLTLVNKRYWRIKLNLTTGDDRYTAQIGAPSLKFSTTGIWISEVIDHTTDITTLDLLTYVNGPAGGISTVIEIATSANNITYTSFGPVGSATPQRYSKIRITMTTTVDNLTSPSVASAEFDWSLLANLVSSVIDTGNTPAGWELFQTSFTLNSGTLLFEMKTASTIPGLTGATYTTVTNGSFITSAVNQYAQWRVTINSHANQVPQVQSVTINWLIQSVASIRVASLFFNKQYYLAAAEFNQTVNNIVFVYDENSTWSVYRGLNINTMGTFFNDAYYGSSVVGKLVKWLDPATTTDQGTNIEFDLRTKAFSSELGDETKTKFLRQLVCKFFGTGARFTPYYSVDGGNTFLALIDVETGLPYYDTNNDSRLVTIRFTPASGSITSGRTLMFRLYNNDSYMVQLHSMRAKCWISPREVLHG